MAIRLTNLEQPDELARAAYERSRTSANIAHAWGDLTRLEQALYVAAYLSGIADVHLGRVAVFDDGTPRSQP